MIDRPHKHPQSLDEQQLKSTFARLSAVMDENPDLENYQSHSSPLHQACVRIFAALGESAQEVPPSFRGGGGDLESEIQVFCKHSGVCFRRVQLQENWMNSSAMPLLVFTGPDYMPTAALPGSQGMRLIGQDGDEIEIMNDDGKLQVHDQAYCFYSSLPQGPVTLKGLLSFSLGHVRKDLLLLILVGLVGATIGLLMPWANQVLFDVVIPNMELGLYWQLILALTVTTVSASMFSVVQSLITLHMTGLLESRVQAGLWDRLLSLPVQFYLKFTSGELIQRVNIFNQTRQVLSAQALSVIFAGLFSIVYGIQMVFYSVELAMIGLTFILASVVIASTTAFLKLPIIANILKSTEKIQGLLVQLIGGIAKLRVSASEPRAFCQWANRFAFQESLRMRLLRIDMFAQSLQALIPICAMATIYVASIRFLSTSELQGGEGLSLGQFLAFMAAYTPFSSAVMQMLATVVASINIIPLWQRSRTITETLPESAHQGNRLVRLKGGLGVDGLSFQYPQAKYPVLQDISFNCQPGEFLAIVGPSGSGKSTLLRLLLGFHPPKSGTVRFDNIEISTLDLSHIRSQIGTVMQQTSLFSGSIRENILMGRTCNLDTLNWAIEQACLREVLEQLPMGLDTHISSDGSSLSGGQCQRVLIARSLVGQPTILLLDEATAALDAETQNRVIQSLRKMGVTLILVAHRISTIEGADQILVLQDGRICERGTFHKLMASGGYFSGSFEQDER